MSEVRFVGGVSGKNMWLEDGKTLSRNYRQGDRVYHEDGLATALTAQPVGSSGGFTSLYLINEKGDDNMTKTNDTTIESNAEVTSFTYVSLFSGIGGFEQALNNLGGTCVMASEFDKFAEQAYEAIYGHATEGDVTEINAEDVPDHDVLVGGFPCQAFSVAGNRAGFEDVRGTLFFDIIRIAAEKKPKALLLENVKGLVNHDKGKTLDTMIQLLNDNGYVVDFDVMNSKYFGVPQNRERIFIVAIREDLIDTEQWKIEGTTIVPKGKQRIGEYEWAKTFNFDFPEQSEVTTRLRDVLEASVDEKYYLDADKTDKLVAQLEEKDVTVGTVGHHPFSKKLEFKGYNSEISPCLIATDYKAPKTILEVKPNMLGLCDIKGNDAIRRVYGSDAIGPTLTTMQGGHQEPKVAEEQTLEVRPVIIPDRMEKRPLRSSRSGLKVVEPRYRIRKLTPLECFRLQAFPDSVHQTLVDAGISDSQRYKMAGNAVTVNVVQALAERLLPLITDEEEDV